MGRESEAQHSVPEMGLPSDCYEYEFSLYVLEHILVHFYHTPLEFKCR